MQVKLKDNMRMLDVDEADFTIHSGETKEISERQLKSYSIKQYLIRGYLRLVEGSTTFTLKAAQVVLVAGEDYVYFKDNGMYYRKEFGQNNTEEIQKDAVPTEALTLLEV
jgi:hypothetical protein